MRVVVRGAVCVALAVLVGLTAAPAAEAQAEPEEFVTVTVEPFQDSIKPLSELGTTNVTVRVSCVLIASSGNPASGGSISLSVTAAPKWAVVTISPASAAIPPFDPARCEGTYYVEHAKLIVATTSDAPAFTPAPIRVQAELESVAGPHAGEAETNVTADFFSIMDARTANSIQAFRDAGDALTYSVTVDNLGNGPTAVAFQTVTVPDDWHVTLPPPFRLDARQTGGTETQRTVPVLVQSPASGLGLRPAAVSVVIEMTSHYADDATIPGDTTRITLLAQPASGTGALVERALPNAESPGGGTQGALLALVLASLMWVTLRRSSEKR